MKSWLGLALVLSLGVPQAGGETRALLVGVDRYPGDVPDLRGCVNDAKRFGSLLTESCGVDPASIRTVTNEQATRHGILRAFEEHLIRGVTPGHTVIFYFAGHGTHTPDLNGDEDDEQDEALCPHDIDPTRPNTWLTDDVLADYLSRIPSPHVLVVLDCCHSGTGTRADQPEFKETRGLPLGFVYEAAKRQFGASRRFRLRPDLKHFAIAAAGPGQIANELTPARFARLGMEEREPAGVLTYSLCQLVEAKPELTFEELASQGTREVDSLVKQLRKISRNATEQNAEFEIPRARIGFSTFVRGETPAHTGGSDFQPTRGAARPAAGLVPEDEPEATASVSNEGVVTSGDIQLKLSTNQRVFREGDPLVVRLEADRDCYVRLYYRNANGEVLQIFPNAGNTRNFLEGGQVVKIPDARDDFEFVMGAPYGSEILKAVAASQQFDDLQDRKWAENLFDPVEEANLRELSTRGTRGIQVKKRLLRKPEPTVFGEATLIYEVWPKS